MSEIRAFFRDTMERILADTLDKGEIDAAENRVLPSRLYDALIGNGITLMLVPEEAGGVGAGIGDAATILRAAGSAAAPGPLLETIIGKKLLALAGFELGDGLLAVQFVDDLALPDPDAGRWTNAVLRDVPWVQAVEQVLTVGRTAEGACLVVTKAADWAVEQGEDAAGEPRDTLRADAIECQSALVGDYDALLRQAAILRAAQIIGAVEWSFRRTVEYSGERKQFGREISKFQAIQQMLAELAGHVLASATLIEAAAESMSAGMIAAARSRLGDAADATISITHQVHGAIGFSYEYGLNARTRRLMAWRDDFGSVLFWRRTLASGFSGLARDEFWPAVSDAGLPAAA